MAAVKSGDSVLNTVWRRPFTVSAVTRGSTQRGMQFTAIDGFHQAEMSDLHELTDSSARPRVSGARAAGTGG